MRKPAFKMNAGFLYDSNSVKKSLGLQFQASDYIPKLVWTQIFLFTFIIDGEQINSFCFQIEVSYHPRATTFPFPFAVNSLPYFIAIIT